VNKRFRVTTFAVLVILAPTWGCAGDDDESAALSPEAFGKMFPAPSGFPPGNAADTAPADNLLTEARAKLGRKLFFDPRLSRTQKVACSTCHRQDHAFAEPSAVSSGVDGRMGNRNAPQLANLAWVRTGLFWDGRIKTLEEQVGKPIENPLEMDLSLSEAVSRVAVDPGYRTTFVDAYGTLPTEDTLRKALASFVRTLVSSNSRYDRFLGADPTAFNASERRGEALFFSSATGCFHCHSEGTLTNDGFFNNGSFVEGGDIGRQEVTGRTGDRGKFRVPGLRNIAVTSPYMHDGSVGTLQEVIEQYARGGRGDPSTDVQIEPLNLTPDEKADLLAFLNALTDDAFLKDSRHHP
jgi:cytochrome c peroxidase